MNYRVISIRDYSNLKNKIPTIIEINDDPEGMPIKGTVIDLILVPESLVDEFKFSELYSALIPCLRIAGENYGRILIVKDFFINNNVNLPVEDLNKSPYHTLPIAKGELGKISKIQEEIDELKDAELQGNKIMQQIELSDLYGEVEFYAETLGLTMQDLKIFSDLNKKVKSVSGSR